MTKARDDKRKNMRADYIRDCGACQELLYGKATVQMCAQQMYGESYSPPMPAELCDNEAEPDSEYCAYHTAPDLWDLADEAYARSKEGGFFD